MSLMRVSAFRGAIVLSLAGPLALAASSGSAQTYYKPEALVIPTNAAATGGRANPYPSTLTVANGPTKIKSVTVKLYSITHLAPTDMNVLLVGPAGQKLLLLRGAGGVNGINNVDLAFSAAATSLVTQNGVITPGTFLPSAYGSVVLPSPAPGLPYSTDLNSLNGTDANGNWSLYLWDSFNDAAGGAIGAGWQLSFVGDIGTEFTYQGVIEKNNQPISGDANVRFTLHPGAVTNSGDAALSGPITRSLTGIENGLFTASLDFGNAILNSQSLWLEVEAESPAGSGFVKVGPRQKLTITPQAGRALYANSVAWSGITGIPDKVLAPVQAFYRNVRQTAGVTLPAAQTTLPNSQQTFALAAGQAVVNWSISGYSSVPNTGYAVRFRIGSTFSEPTIFFFNQNGVHQTMAGNAIINVAAGTQTCDIVVTRDNGTGQFQVDTNDSVSYTITNIKQ